MLFSALIVSLGYLWLVPLTHENVEGVQGIILSRLKFISLVINTRALQKGFCLRYNKKTNAWL